MLNIDVIIVVNTFKMTKNITKTKKKILEALEGVKEFELVWTDEVTYSVNVKAKSEEEAREMFENGEVKFSEKNIIEDSFCENSLEVYEVEN